MWLLFKLTVLKENLTTFSWYFPGPFLCHFFPPACFGLNPNWFSFPSEITRFPHSRIWPDFFSNHILSCASLCHRLWGCFVLPYFEVLGVVIAPRSLFCCQRSFWDSGSGRTFLWQKAAQEPAVGCDPKGPIVRKSIHGFALSPSCRTFWGVMVELLSVGGVEGCSSVAGHPRHAQLDRSAMETHFQSRSVGSCSCSKYFWYWWQHLPGALSVCSW